jgi:hypothetical protein
VTLTETSAANQTFFGLNLTARLPDATATNVGTQFIITNVNTTNNNLTVTTVTGDQDIYSSTGAARETSKTLNQAHSQIFTAIQVGASTFGWSMV